MDVLQAGCDSDVMSSGGQLQRQLKPWWEWLPGDTVWITNLPVAQGDTLNCTICCAATAPRGAAATGRAGGGCGWYRAAP
jgi:hypothetical protein